MGIIVSICYPRILIMIIVYMVMMSIKMTLKAFHSNRLEIIHVNHSWGNQKVNKIINKDKNKIRNLVHLITVDVLSLNRFQNKMMKNCIKPK